MAFMSVFLMSIPAVIIAIITFLVFITGIVFIILFFVFLILYLLDKTKKWKKMAFIICGIIGFSILIIYFIVGLLVNEVLKDKIDLGNGEQIRISHGIVTDFYENIEKGNINEVSKLLEKYPHLINSYKYDSNSPLETAIISKQYNCVKLFVERNVDINMMNKEGNIGPIELELIHFDTDNKGYRNYDEKIMEYLLCQKDIDVNKRNGDTPNLQNFIELILSDNNITEKEEELLILMLDKNANIYELNKKSQNISQFLDGLEYSENVSRIKRIVNKYY